MTEIKEKPNRLRIELDNKNDIGGNIRKFRERNKLSQSQLAEKIYTTKSTISKGELGSIEPSVRTLRLLAKELKVDVYDIIGENASLHKRISVGVDKLISFLLVGIHGDITLVGTLYVTLGVTFGVLAIIAPLIGIVPIVNAESNGGSAEDGGLVFGSILMAPGLFFTMVFAVYGTVYMCKSMGNFSLKFFGRTQMRLKLPNYRVSKKLQLVIAISIAVMVLFCVIYFPIMGANDLGYKIDS